MPERIHRRQVFLEAFKGFVDGGMVDGGARNQSW